MLNVQITAFNYTAEKRILENLSFILRKGEHLSVLGESGCGKSTLIHIIYGLLHLKNGNIHWNQTKLLGPNHRLIPGEPFMKLVSQELDLMPYTSVSENIAEHLNRQNKSQDNGRVEELLAVVQLESRKNAKVITLSGGQKQRVAIAKALANEPKLLLLDEPFSSIDNYLKSKLRRNLFSYLKKKGITCITATHDSEEALSFSDKILLLKNGKAEMYGEPKEIFSSFNTTYQGSFFGDVSELESKLVMGNSKTPFVYLLPHQLGVSDKKTALQVKIQNSFYKGTHYLIVAKHLGKHVYFNHDNSLASGDRVYLKQVFKSNRNKSASGWYSKIRLFI